jgi:selenocysteine lyase/cysteine desulfurase
MGSPKPARFQRDERPARRYGVTPSRIQQLECSRSGRLAHDVGERCDGLHDLLFGVLGREEEPHAGRHLADRCAAGLGELAGVRVARGAEAAAIVSFTVEGYDPADVAAILEQAAGVQVRSGFHCAALVHEHLGTRVGGTVRASFGPFNTAADVEALVGAVAAIVRG